MALVFRDRVRAVTTTTGTGTLTLGSAVTGYQAFSAIGDGNTCYFCIEAVDSNGIPTGDWEVSLGTYTSSGTTLSRTSILSSSNSGSAVSLSAGTKHVFVVSPAGYVGMPLDTIPLRGGYITATASAGALTISVLTKSGATPTPGEPVYSYFRSATATSGSVSEKSIIASNTLVLSSGSTLGFTSSVAGKVWVVLFDDAGTLRLGAIKCFDGTTIYPLRDDMLASSTAEGGAGAADSAGVFYTGTAVSAKALRVLGYLEWSSGMTAGTWIDPTKIQNFTSGVSLPGSTIQTARSETATRTTTTSTIPIDDTIPQNTEGGQFFSQAITPTSSANVLSLSTYCWASSSGAGVAIIYAFFQDSTANALFAGDVTIVAADYRATICGEYRMLAGTTSSTTLKMRMGGSSASTTSINGFAGARYYGGVSVSWFQIVEIAT